MNSLFPFIKSPTATSRQYASRNTRTKDAPAKAVPAKVEPKSLDSSKQQTASNKMVEIAAREKMAELRKALAADDSYTPSFPRHLAESLQVSNDVIVQMMTLEEMQALRKRAGILGKLEECKERIVTALEMADETADDIPWGRDDVQESRDLGSHVNFEDPDVEKLDEDTWRRKNEQSEILSEITRYIQACKEKDGDMAELVDWMSNFAFEVTWDEVGVRPLEERESEEMDSYRGVVLAIQKAWQCARKLKQLTQLMTSDDSYDVLSSKLPVHVAAARAKRKNTAAGKLWTSHKLRNKLDSFCNLREGIRSSGAKKGATDVTSLLEITPLTSGEDPLDNPYKESEALILQEIGSSWKEASRDVMYYAQEVISHRFTKNSCKKRLERALLLLEFINASIEGKLMDAEKTQAALRETKITVARMGEEAASMQKEMGETQKILTAARRKITKQKKQMEAAQRENEKLSTKIGSLHDKVDQLTKQVEELQDLPNQSEFDECKERLDELEEEFTELEAEADELREDLGAKTQECDTLRKKLEEEKDTSASLAEAVTSLEDEIEKASKDLKEQGEKLSAQENNIMSLRLMVYYKDEVIRRLKQAAIDLKSNEKQQKVSPRKPPPSPDNVTGMSAESVVSQAPSTKTSGAVQEKMTRQVSSQIHQVASAVAEPAKEPEVVTSSEVTQQQEVALRAEVKSSKYCAQQEQSERLTKGKTSSPWQQTTRVLYKPDEREELIENAERAQVQLNDMRGRLDRMSQGYQLKLKSAVDQERHKSVLEKMKNEEELQNLCFAVCDETMRVQKEMKKFNENLSGQLKTLIGLKGNLFEDPSSGGDRKRKTGGLLTMVTSSLEGVGRNPGGKRKKAVRYGEKGHCDVEEQQQEQESGGIMSFMGGMSAGGMDLFGGAELPSMNDQDPLAADEYMEDDIVVPGGNYWKSLKTALVGKEKKGDNAPPARQQENPRKSLAARVLAEKQRRLSMQVSSETVPQSSSGYGSVPQLSSGSIPQNNPDFVPQFTSDATFPQSEPAPQISIEIPQAESIPQIASDPQSSSASIPQFGSDFVSQISFNIVPQNSVASFPQRSLPQFSNYPSYVTITSNSDEEQDILFLTSSGDVINELYVTPSAGTNEQPQITFTLEPCGAGQNADDGGTADKPRTLVDRRMARLGQRRRSSVAPLGDMLRMARRQSIRQPPKPKVVKFRGFFGGEAREDRKRRDALSREAAAKRRRENMEEDEKRRKEQKKKAVAQATGIEDDPLKQAEVFVRNISGKVINFLGGMSHHLVDAIRESKDRSEMQIEQMQQEVTSLRVQAQGELTRAREEKETKAAEAKKARQALVEILSGKSKEQWSPPGKLPDPEDLSVSVLAGMKDAEEQMEEMSRRLASAANNHSKLAQDYSRRATDLESKAKLSEQMKQKAERQLRIKSAENRSLRIRLHEFRKSHTEKMFLSLKQHDHNRQVLLQSDDMDDVTKQVALSLLQRSSRYPGVRLRNMAMRYKQHHEMKVCMERIRSKIKDENDGSRVRGAKSKATTKSSASTERSMMRTLLTRLEARYGHLRAEWSQIGKNLENSRQMALVKITVLLHKLQQGRGNPQLVQPIIRKMPTSSERPHNNSPVPGAPTGGSNYSVVFPLCGVEDAGHRAAPNSLATETATSYCEEDKQSTIEPHKVLNDDVTTFDVIGSTPPANRSRGQRLSPQWLPGNSVFCPFSNHSGRLVPANSRQKLPRFEDHVTAYERQKRRLPPITPQTKGRRHKQRASQLIEFPRIVQLDVQAGLRHAKAIVTQSNVGEYPLTPTLGGRVYLQSGSSEWSSSWSGSESMGGGVEMDFTLPPCAPDLKRGSAIPSPQRGNHPAKSPIHADWSENPRQGTQRILERSFTPTESLAPSSASSSTRSLVTLPSINRV